MKEGKENFLVSKVDKSKLEAVLVTEICKMKPLRQRMT